MYVSHKRFFRLTDERLTSVLLVSFTLYSRLGGKLYVVVNKIFSCRVRWEDKTNRWWGFYEQGNKHRYKFILNIYLLSARRRNSPNYKVNYIDFASFFNKSTIQTSKISLLRFTTRALRFIVTRYAGCVFHCTKRNEIRFWQGSSLPSYIFQPETSGMFGKIN